MYFSLSPGQPRISHLTVWKNEYLDLPALPFIHPSSCQSLSPFHPSCSCYLHLSLYMIFAITGRFFLPPFITPSPFSLSFSSVASLSISSSEPKQQVRMHITRVCVCV